MKKYRTPNIYKRISKSVEYDENTYVIVFDGEGDLLAAFDEEGVEVNDMHILHQLEGIMCENFNEWLNEYDNDAKYERSL